MWTIGNKSDAPLRTLLLAYDYGGKRDSKRPASTPQEVSPHASITKNTIKKDTLSFFLPQIQQLTERGDIRPRWVTHDVGLRRLFPRPTSTHTP
jgi:hypothetical protein